MIITVDTDKQTLNGESLYTNSSFELLSDLWLKVGWSLKYPYTFSWLGFPILQIPEDMIRMQEVITRLKPDVILETGVAHGGSLIFYASLCKLLGRGRVIGVEKGLICRKQIESHYLSDEFITLVEGDSTAPSVVNEVYDLIDPSEKVLVILDSCHSKHHVHKELDAYHKLIAPGFYVIVQDGNMSLLHDVPRGKPEWELDNPSQAVLEFIKTHPEFIIEEPPRIFNESTLTKNITYHTNGFLKRL
jgi:cephalosporin hydroxylase